MGQAKQRKLANKILLEKYKDDIDKCISELELYQIYKTFKLDKRGEEILALAEAGKLNIEKFKDRNIHPTTIYSINVSEWQWLQHKSTLEQRILSQKHEDPIQAYRDWIENFIEKMCIEKPDQYRKITKEEVMKEVEMEKLKHQLEAGTIEAPTITDPLNTVPITESQMIEQ